MTEVAQYRFLPWTRRGLAAEVAGQDAPDLALPQRAAVSVGVTITGAGPAGVDLTLYGPGDVLGIDPRLIVRTDPRPGSTDVEPNYLPAVELDPPDLPWMFTPAGAGVDDRLRPWLVLVCVDRAVVDPPHLASADGARPPLPVIELTAPAVASELPDLRESWAWAHGQVTTGNAAGPVTPSALAEAPVLNVSRLVCPRRLRPGRQYVACLVPAFDAGVRRGLTGTQPPPSDDGPALLAPAWDVDAPADLILPVYFHWEFATGPAGDFEELARRLEPVRCPDTVGYAVLHVGHGGPDLPAIQDGQPGARVDMDGALRAPSGSPGRLDEVAPVLREGLRRAVNASADNADASATDETPVLGPPLYGEWHTGRHRVAPPDTGWFGELNLDPRSRVAAGLATEVVRRYQEELLHSAWEQVGKVRDANTQLSWGRLAVEVGRRWHERHLQPLPAPRLAQLAAPMAARVVLGDRTVRAAAARTSLPDAAVDPAMRRLTSGRHRLVRRAVLRAGGTLTAGDAAAPSHLMATLARGRADVDPNVFELDGLARVTALEEVAVPATGAAPVDLGQVGLPIELPADVVRVGRERFRTVRDVLAGLGEGMTADSLVLRGDLRVTGLFTIDHVRAVAEAPSRGGLLSPGAGTGAVTGTVLDAGELPLVLDAVRAAAAANPQAVALQVDSGPGRLRVDALDVDRRGNVLVRTPVTRASVRIGTVTESLLRSGTERIGEALTRLGPGTFPSARGRIERIPVIEEPDRTFGRAGPRRRRPSRGAEDVLTQTVPVPIRDGAVITRFEAAWGGVRASLQQVPAVPARTVVPFPVADASAAVLSATDPVTVVPRRLATMLTVQGVSLLSATVPGLEVAREADRVLAYPELPLPAYDLLARYDRDRFVPGIDVLPANAITLVETNPRFVEAFLVGLNHELNRELLWREYPTDRRGTPMRHFWAWSDGGPDIGPIHGWRDDIPLGGGTRGSGEGQAVLLVRGDLLRRYPNTVVVAWRADGDRLKEPPGPGDVVQHVLTGRFDPDVTFFGFPLTTDQLASGWFFVLAEQPTEPRFGLDTGPAGTLTTWAAATWAHTATGEGAHLRLGGNPLAGTTRNAVTFGRNAGHLAAVMLQRPVRVAVASSEIVGAQ